MDIITGKNTKILREIAQPIEEITPDIQKLIPEMRKTMRQKHGNYYGAGLSAPQVGLSIRLFIAEPNWTITKSGKLYVCINPEITARSKEIDEIEDGCLSLPGYTGISTRHRAVTLAYTNEYEKKVKTKAKGLLAWVFQHEIDHLNGILFIDKAKYGHERTTPSSSLSI